MTKDFAFCQIEKVLLAIFLAASGCFTCFAIGQDPSPAQSALQEKAEKLRERLFPKCGDVYDSGPLTIDDKMGAACNFLVDHPSKNCQVVLEVEAIGASPLTLIPNSQAKDNDAWILSLNASHIRTRYKIDGIWQPWRPPTVPAHLRYRFAVLYDRGGQWYISDMRMMGLQEALPLNPLEVLSSVLAGTRSNETFHLLNPRPFDEVLNSLQQPRCGEIFGEESPSLEPGDKRAKETSLVATTGTEEGEPMADLPSSRVDSEDKQFRGTANGFAEAFPKFLHKAALTESLDPKKYQPESDFVMQTIRTCAQITPEMGSRAINKYGLEDLSKLGTQYVLCHTSPLASASKSRNAKIERTIVFMIYPVGKDDLPGRWKDAQSFRAQIMFSGMGANPLPIVTATIHVR